MVFTPEVIEAKVNEELRWVGRLAIPGIFDGEHYFILESHEGHQLELAILVRVSLVKELLLQFHFLGLWRTQRYSGLSVPVL